MKKIILFLTFILLFITITKASIDNLKSEVPNFGHDMKSQFGLAKNYVNLNHGSYGSPALMVIDR